jgi:hypothetical protein
LQQPRGVHRKLCSRGVVPAVRTVDPLQTYTSGEADGRLAYLKPSHGFVRTSGVPCRFAAEAGDQKVHKAPHLGREVAAGRVQGV